jgi:hypothetical protein
MEGYLDFARIHEIITAFDTKCVELSSECLPLCENVIMDTLRPIGLAIPASLLYMWC